MVAFRPLSLALGLLFLAAAPRARADEPADSAAYAAKRKLLLEQGPGERAGAVLAAAEDLARDGYYSEALDLLFSMQDTSQVDYEDEFDRALAAAARPAPAVPNRPFGYAQAGADYDRWDGIDTLLTAHVRGKLEWDPPGPVFERLAAVAQGSDRNAYFDFTAKGAAWRRLLRFEAEGLAEKLLARAYGDSLDRAYLLLKLEPTTRPLGHPLAFEAPAFLETEMYRHERFGSPSHYAAGIAPGLQAMSGNTAKSLLLSWDLRGSAYPGTPAYSHFRDGPVASGWWYGERLAFDAETRLATTRYRRDTSLVRDRRIETRAAGTVRLWRWFRAGLRVAGDTEMEDYRDTVRTAFDTVAAGYRLTGSSWSVRPELSAEWRGSFSATAGLTFTRARYPLLAEAGGLLLDNELYLNTSSDDWLAEAGFTMLTKAIFLTLTLGYEENRVPYRAIYAVGSSAGASAACNFTWKLRPWFEIDAACEAVRRLRLAEGYAVGMISGNLVLSAGVTSRFP